MKSSKCVMIASSKKPHNSGIFELRDDCFVEEPLHEKTAPTKWRSSPHGGPAEYYHCDDCVVAETLCLKTALHKKQALLAVGMRSTTIVMFASSQNSYT